MPVSKKSKPIGKSKENKEKEPQKEGYHSSQESEGEEEQTPQKNPTKGPNNLLREIKERQLQKERGSQKRKAQEIQREESNHELEGENDEKRRFLQIVEESQLIEKLEKQIEDKVFRYVEEKMKEYVPIETLRAILKKAATKDEVEKIKDKVDSLNKKIGEDTLLEQQKRATQLLNKGYGTVFTVAGRTEDFDKLFASAEAEKIPREVMDQIRQNFMKTLRNRLRARYRPKIKEMNREQLEKIDDLWNKVKDTLLDHEVDWVREEFSERVKDRKNELKGELQAEQQQRGQERRREDDGGSQEKQEGQLEEILNGLVK